MTFANDPAFPMLNSEYGGIKGLTKREYFAAKVMSGILASPLHANTSYGVMSESAVRAADALIAELERTKP